MPSQQTVASCFWGQRSPWQDQQACGVIVSVDASCWTRFCLSFCLMFNTFFCLAERNAGLRWKCFPHKTPWDFHGKLFIQKSSQVGVVKKITYWKISLGRWMKISKHLKVTTSSIVGDLCTPMTMFASVPTFMSWLVPFTRKTRTADILVCDGPFSEVILAVTCDYINQWMYIHYIHI